MVTEVHNDLSEVLMVLWKIWFYHQIIYDTFSVILKCQLRGWMVITQRKTRSSPGKNTIDTWRTGQHYTVEPITGPAVLAIKQKLEIIRLRLTSMVTQIPLAIVRVQVAVSELRWSPKPGE